ncbi:hypothetical protein [Brevibacterium spongiae]|uniref:Uncharacterized protein n=1 Tax=Brevibacterium spongiae TaxID=2909672 RepID=A0ABY5ST79_9MICO|nr:hypothetical protein [Brevibacterium spongiae]UVI37752.1 hypothetical protein L1F31_08940 [Brevibacterium spongiae]
MTDEFTDPDAQYDTIRMFPDYADTVLWFDGPVDYCDTGLTAALVSDLERWEKSFYESRTDDFEFVSRAAGVAHEEEGLRLAERVSAEVGPRFVITCDSIEDRYGQVTLRATSPSENPTAEAAFRRLRQERMAEDMRMAEILAESDGTITAYAPLSGATFELSPRSDHPQNEA